MKFNLLKQWQIWLLLIGVIISLYLILPIHQEGLIVKSIKLDSPFNMKIKPGGVLTWINEKEIKDLSDISEFENYTGFLRFMYNGQLVLIELEEPGLGLGLEKKSPSNVKFGMDIIGGTRVLLKSEENVSSDIMDQVLSTLETRINIYGLKEAKFQIVEDIEGNKYAQVEIGGGSKEDVDELLAKQGKFKGKIQKFIKLENDEAVLFDEKIKYSEGNIIVNDKEIKYNESFEIDDIEFEYYNVTKDKILLLANVFTEYDIKSVCIQEQAGICISRLIDKEEGTEFMFQVTITDDGSKRFAKITEGMDVIVDESGTGTHLEGKLILFLDENSITDLSISSGLAGKEIKNPTITGGAKTREEAKNDKLKLQSILQSGALPTKLEIVKIEEISPTLGQRFISTIGIAGIAALLCVSLVIFIRYRKPKIVLPVILTSIFEVIMILGVAAYIGWTIDLAAIVGIIAAVGTGVDALIMILDEVLMKEKDIMYSLKMKIKRALFIIFGSAFTTISAMIPLMIIGIGVMRGFAITTTLGVLIGVFIARPAFSKVAEKLLSDE